MTTRLEKFYKEEVVPKLMKQFGGKKGKKMMARMGGMGGFGGPDMGGMGGFPM